MTFEVIVDYDCKSGWREFSTLRVFHYGKQLCEHRDQGEPEDNTFSRDWDWVPTMIEKAYALGLEDGKKLANNKTE